MKDAILFATLSSAKHLLIAHHDPAHSDDQLSKLYEDLQLNNENRFNYEMAEEGMEFELP
jgi:uncharacterized protein (DUF2249 family)